MPTAPSIRHYAARWSRTRRTARRRWLQRSDEAARGVRKTAKAKPRRPRKRPSLASAGIVRSGRRVRTMASLPADEDYARSVLAIFGLKNVRPRGSLAVSDVKAAFLI